MFILKKGSLFGNSILITLTPTLFAHNSTFLSPSFKSLSNLSNNFIDSVRLGINQLPAFMSNILTRTTEIPFEAVSDIVVEPILRFLVPGTSEEERQKIIADIAAKDQTQAAFLEGARGRIQEILKLTPNSKEQLDAIGLLQKEMVAKNLFL